MTPKAQSETPPPTYEEALVRQSVRLPAVPDDPETADPAAAAGGPAVTAVTAGLEVHQHDTSIESQVSE